MASSSPAAEVNTSPPLSPSKPRPPSPYKDAAADMQASHPNASGNSSTDGPRVHEEGQRSSNGKEVREPELPPVKNPVHEMEAQRVVKFIPNFLIEPKGSCYSLAEMFVHPAFLHFCLVAPL